MELNYTLDEADYLEHQLYDASKSARIKKQRRQSWFFATLPFLSLCFLCYVTGHKAMMYASAGVGILIFLFYPLYLKRFYYKHYQKYIADTCKNRFNEPCNIIFNEDSINSTDMSGEAKINLSIIEEIAETGKYIYLKIKTGGHLIIPKLKLENVTLVQTNLAALADRLQIEYIKEPEWKWK